MTPLEYIEVKSEPGETIAERVKCHHQNRKNIGTGLKNLTPNRLLTRLPILLAQIKAGNNSYKLKNEIRQMLHLLYQHNQMILLKEPKTFYFDWPKDVGNNFPTTTTLRIDVNSTPILRSYVKKKISMYFHVVSMYFFNVISVGEKSTSFPHSLFQVILMRKKSRLF